MEKDDCFKKLLKNICEVRNVSLKPKFETIEDLVIINIKNNLKVGVDLDCLKILNIIHHTVAPLNIKHDQQMHLYPNGDRLDSMAIIFTRDAYEDLNRKIQSGEF